MRDDSHFLNQATPTYALYQGDAFTTQPLHGNPCAVIFDCADLGEETMLAIAKEMNLSETAFVWRMDYGRFRARYFTPAKEIPLAGHPTVATIYALIDSGRQTYSQIMSSKRSARARRN